MIKITKTNEQWLNNITKLLIPPPLNLARMQNLFECSNPWIIFFIYPSMLEHGESTWECAKISWFFYLSTISMLDANVKQKIHKSGHHIQSSLSELSNLLMLPTSLYTQFIITHIKVILSFKWESVKMVKEQWKYPGVTLTSCNVHLQSKSQVPKMIAFFIKNSSKWHSFALALYIHYWVIYVTTKTELWTSQNFPEVAWFHL